MTGQSQEQDGGNGKRVFAYVFLTVCSLIFLDQTGLVGFISVVALGGAFWYWTLRRGRLAVRALIYLDARRNGASVAEANYTAMTIGYREAVDLAPATKAAVETAFGGRQLLMIAMARADGFAG